jgi:hypothetical protein
MHEQPTPDAENRNLSDGGYVVEGESASLFLH